MFKWLKNKIKGSTKTAEAKPAKAKLLYFKSNQAAFEFALVSLMNGCGTMNMFHVGIIESAPYGKKKKVREKIEGDTETVTEEISKYKIKVAFKGEEVKSVGTRTDNLALPKKPPYKTGDLVIITDLSQTLMDQMTGKARDKNLEYKFEIMGKREPIFNADKMDFER